MKNEEWDLVSRKQSVAIHGGYSKSGAEQAAAHGMAWHGMARYGRARRDAGASLLELCLLCAVGWSGWWGWVIFPWPATRQVAALHEFCIIHHPEWPKVVLVAHKTLVEWQIGAYRILHTQTQERERSQSSEVKVSHRRHLVRLYVRMYICIPSGVLRLVAQACGLTCCYWTGQNTHTLARITQATQCYLKYV